MEKLERQDPWHYPRPKLAEKYLQVFDIGLIARSRSGCDSGRGGGAGELTY